MKVWGIREVFNSMIEEELNELQKEGAKIVSVYPSSFDGVTHAVSTVTIVFTEEDVEE